MPVFHGCGNVSGTEGKRKEKISKIFERFRLKYPSGAGVHAKNGTEGMGLRKWCKVEPELHSLK